METIKLETLEKNANEFSIDFYHFTIKGKAEPKARDIFYAINELVKYRPKPLPTIRNCMDDEAKEEFDRVVKTMDEELNSANESERASIFAKYDIKLTSLLNSYAIRNDLPSIDVISAKARESFVGGKMPYINKMFATLINDSALNKSFNVEFVAEGDDDGVSVEAKTKMIEEMAKSKQLSDMAEVVCNTYKKDFIDIYESVMGSVDDFLEKYK